MKKLLLLFVCTFAMGACFKPLPPIVTLPEARLPIVNAQTAGTWNSTDYAEKPVMLVFMGSWCPWCKKTMPAVIEVANEFGDQVEIVAVFMDNKTDPVQAAVKEHNFTVKSLYNGGEFAESVGVHGLPHTILFNKKHQMIKQWEGFSPDRANDYREALKKITK